MTDPEVLALARHNIFAEVFFFLLGRLIYLFALDRFHLKIRGLENLPEKGPYLLCSNHQSYIDALVMAAALPWRLFRDTFALGTSDIFGQGFMRWLARWIRVVVLDPDANLVPAMRAGAFGLSQGRILILYPEGERTNDGNPRVFRKGAAILSIHTPGPDCPGRDRRLLRSLAAPQEVSEVHRFATGIRQADSTSAARGSERGRVRTADVRVEVQSDGDVAGIAGKGITRTIRRADITTVDSESPVRRQSVGATAAGKT